MKYRALIRYDTIEVEKRPFIVDEIKNAIWFLTAFLASGKGWPFAYSIFFQRPIQRPKIDFRCWFSV